MGADDDGQRDAQGAQDEPQGAPGAHDGDDQAGQPEGAAGQEGVGGTPDYEAQLRQRDARIAELEAQVAAAAESKATAVALTRKIEQLRQDAAAERLGYELRLAGCRDAKAASAVLADHGGRVEQLKADLPWMFEDARPAGGTTGLPPAGAAGGGTDADLRRWERIAGLTDEGKEG